MVPNKLAIPLTVLGACLFLAACVGSSARDPGDGIGVETAGNLPSLAGSAVDVARTPYVVGPQDVIEVSVYKVPELSKVVQVSGVGTVNLSLIGEVPVGGKTTVEIERLLAGRYGARYIKSPQVSVLVKEFNSQRFTVEGAVKKPGNYPIRGSNSLLQAIATAEGMDRDVASGTVVIFRSSGSGRVPLRFDVSQIREGAAADPDIKNNDVIVVGESAAKVAFNQFSKVIPVAGAAASVAAATR